MSLKTNEIMMRAKISRMVLIKSTNVIMRMHIGDAPWRNNTTLLFINDAELVKGMDWYYK